MVNSKIYHYARFATNSLLLNLLWLVFCLPIVTIAPATVALFGVVKTWQVEQEYLVFAPFVRQFKRNLLQRSLFGTLWLLFGVVIVSNFVLVTRFGTMLQFIVIAATTFIGLIYLLSSVFLPPLLVTYPLGLMRTLKYALILAMARFSIAMLCLLIVAGIVLLTYLVPLLLLIAGSVAASLIYRLCRGVFETIEASERERMRQMAEGSVTLP